MRERIERVRVREGIEKDRGDRAREIQYTAEAAVSFLYTSHSAFPPDGGYEGSGCKANKHPLMGVGYF